jgi:protein O-mannosyl-transferase
MKLSAQTRWLLAVTVLAITLAYTRALTGAFIWDDDAHVTANPAIVGPQGLKDIWTSAKANYFPLTMTSFWVQHALWGLSPALFHLVTILFHVASVLMLWAVLARLGIPGAWVGAMLWGLHPVQVESVAWICELKNTQSCFFFLAAVWFFLRWLESREPLVLGRDYVLAVVAAVLAILSKSSTVMLPIVLGLVAWWTGRARWRWAELRWLVPFLAVSFAASVWTIWEQKVNSMASGPEWSHGFASRLVIAGKIVWFYLGKLAWPEPLIFIYPRWTVDDFSFTAWLPLIAALALGVGLWRTRHGRFRAICFASAYFVVSLFPVLGFFDVFFFRYSFVGDHLQYLASIGPLALAGAGIAGLGSRLTLPAKAQGAIVASLLLILGLLTWRQSRIYHNNYTLWGDTIRQNPNAWIARVNWAVELVAAGRAAEALPHYEAALRLKPQFKEIEVNLGAALIHLGRPAEAIPHFENALTGKFGAADAHNGLGFALSRLGRTAEAIPHYEAALRLKPNMEAAHYNLGNALAQLQRLPEALEHYATNVRAMPRAGMYRDALARTLAGLGRVPEAVDHYRAAAELNPADFEAQSMLAALLPRLGAVPEAVARGEAACRLRPNAPDAHLHLGVALVAASRAPEAIAHFDEAVRLQPNYVEARQQLAHLLYQTGRPGEALPHYEVLAGAQPESSDAHNNLASALLHAGRIPEAIKHYETALRLKPGNAEARTNLAVGLAALGRLSDAIAQCRQALQLQPDYAPARTVLDKLEATQRAQPPAK